MPTITELETLVDLSVEDAMPQIDYSAFDMSFESDNLQWIWIYSSSTATSDGAYQFWGINFYDGMRTFFAPQFILSRARCVR